MIRPIKNTAKTSFERILFTLRDPAPLIILDSNVPWLLLRLYCFFAEYREARQIMMKVLGNQAAADVQKEVRH